MVTLVVYTADGRTDSVDIKLTGAPLGAPSVSISSDVKTVNHNSKLELFGVITAFNQQSAIWLIDDPTLAMAEIALTSITKNFGDTEARQGVVYPLSIAPFNLLSGKTYTFTLASSPLSNSTLVAYGKITLTINSPPHPGQFVVDPSVGLSLVTSFVFRGFGWTDDDTDLPIKYAFKYQLSPLSDPLKLAMASEKSFIITNLPSGLIGYDYKVTCIMLVSDVWLAEQEIDTVIDVHEDTSVDPNDQALQILSTSLIAAFESQNIDQVRQIVNNVASSLSTINCTLAPDCFSLNRSACENTPQTCESCISGYVGIVGPSNTQCYPKASLVHMHPSISSLGLHTVHALDVGEPCMTNDECLYGFCNMNKTLSFDRSSGSGNNTSSAFDFFGGIFSNSSMSNVGVCKAPPKVCPTMDMNATCSGHGSCNYTDPSGGLVDTCLQTNVNCQPFCVCDYGWGGRGCRFDYRTLEMRASSRLILCGAMLNATMMSDPSAELLVGLAASLKQSYDPIEAEEGSPEGQALCSTALSRLSDFLAMGYLKSAGSSAAQTISSTISLFVSRPKSSDESTTSSPTSSPTEPMQYHTAAVAASVANLQLGMVGNMVGGQIPQAVVTDNVRLAAHRTIGSSLSGSGLNPPKTAAEAQYAAPSPQIILPRAGLTGCGMASNAYSQLSVMQWGINPFGSSGNTSAKDIKSPILRFANTAPPNNARRLQAAEVNDDPYYIVLQLTTEISASSNQTNNSTSNHAASVHIPKCQMPSATGYVDCPCNVSSVGLTNVTYICYDISFICPAVSSRRLEETDESSVLYDPFIANQQQEEQRRSLYDENYDSRRLDDSTSMSDYGALLAALAAALASVLSQNPFAIDLNQAKWTLVMIACILSISMYGCSFFKKWDMADRNALLYLKDFEAEDAKDEDEEELERLRQARRHDLNIRNAFNSRATRRIASNFLNSSALEKKVAKMRVLKESREAEYLKEIFDHKDDTPIVEVITGDEQFRKEGEQKAAEFFQSILPESMLILENTMWEDFLKALLVQHDWIAPFSFPSMQLSRYLRWMAFFNDIMITLFFDTLFYMVMYPPGLCEAMIAEPLCVAVPSQVMAGAKQCQWTSVPGSINGGTCSLTDPPSSFLFSAFVSLLVIVLALPWSIISHIVIEEVCGCIPDFESIGLDGDFWFGRPVLPMSDLNAAALSIVTKDDSELITASKDAATNILGKQFFFDFVSIRSELDHIISRMTDVFEVIIDQTSKGYVDPDFMKHFKALVHRMHMRTDGVAHMELMKTLQYGTARNRIHKRIERARKASADILERLEGFGEGEYNFRDQLLLQSFVLEQFNYIKRLGLKKEFFGFDECFPGSVDPIIYFASWAFVWGTYSFCLYWMLMWGVKVGSVTLLQWFLCFLQAWLQDGLAISPLRIFIFCGLTITLAKPQLRDVYNTLINVASVKLQDGFKLGNSLRLVQHFSGACRAARASVRTKQPGARILMSLDDVDIVQCRRLRDTKIGWLPFIILLTPMIMAALGEFGSEMGIGFFLPIVWSMFTVSQEALMTSFQSIFITLWCFIGIYILHCWGVFDDFYTSIEIYDEVKFIKKSYFRTVSRLKHFRKNIGPSYIYRKVKEFLRIFLRKNLLSFNSQHEELWKNFNRHNDFQGKIMSSNRLEVISRKINSYSYDVEFPESVQRLVVKSFSLNWSHDTYFVTRLCNRILWGALHEQGSQQPVVDDSQQKHQHQEYQYNTRRIPIPIRTKSWRSEEDNPFADLSRGRKDLDTSTTLRRSLDLKYLEKASAGSLDTYEVSTVPSLDLNLMQQQVQVPSSAADLGPAWFELQEERPYAPPPKVRTKAPEQQQEKAATSWWGQPTTDALPQSQEDQGGVDEDEEPSSWWENLFPVPRLH